VRPETPAQSARIIVRYSFASLLIFWTWEKS
jgi:hypothetical protein